MSLSQSDLDELKSADPSDVDVQALRLDLLDEARAVRRELYRKSAGDGRVRDVDKAEARQGYANEFTKLMNAELRLLSDIEEAQTNELLAQAEEALDIDR